MSSAATGGGGAATGGAAASTAASFVFENPSVYDLFEETDEVDKETGIPIPVIYLPVGAKVFRADRMGAIKPSNEVPAFFGNKETIAPYARRRNEGVNLPESETHSAFLVKNSPRLFHMNLNSLNALGALISEKLQIEKQHILNYALIMLSEYYDREELYVYPTKLLENPKEGEHMKYLNREIANIICMLGYDGWIVKPYDPKKSQGLEQYSFLQKKVVPYPPEIMLCKWNDFMKPTSLVGGRRKRARKTRRRKQ